MTTSLFEPTQVGPLTIKNRIVMAAMTRSRADNSGVIGEITKTYYQQRAGAGLIISEALYPSAMGKGYMNTPGMHTDEQVAAWREVTKAVHEAGGRIYAQIMHAGRISDPSFLPGGATPVAPSAVQPKGGSYTADGMKPHVQPRALEKSEIRQVVEEYIYSTQRALEAGFDGVQLHAGNGFLPMQFLSSNSNLRSDEYGGNVRNRARFAVELLEAMIAVAGPGRVALKITPGKTFNDMADANPTETHINLLAQSQHLDLAFIDASPDPDGAFIHAFLKPLARAPYFIGGGLTSESARDLVATGQADAAIFGQLFIANPDLPYRLERGAPLAVPDPSTFYAGGSSGYVDYPAVMVETIDA